MYSLSHSSLLFIANLHTSRPRSSLKFPYIGHVLIVAYLLFDSSRGSGAWQGEDERQPPVATGWLDASQEKIINIHNKETTIIYNSLMSSNHRAWQPMLTKQTTSAKIKATTLANELGLEVTLATRQNQKFGQLLLFDRV